MQFSGKLITVQVKKTIFCDAIDKLGLGKEHLEVKYIPVESTQVNAIPHSGEPVENDTPRIRLITIQWFEGKNSGWKLTDNRVEIIE